MGTWDYGPFDNDSALDLVGDLADRPAGETVPELRATMLKVLDAGSPVDAWEMNQALAAASVVAGRIDPALLDDEDEAEVCAGRLGPELDAEFRALAVRVFDRAFRPDDNEWYDLWVESEALDEVEVAHAPYRAVLSGS
ncbi:hypothetical protein DPM19_09115 [Actinomadura craniellae]|uniref:DUF4259 domain-containing protein n=1 Tax=Actinomadura craniellae TaxID=2231787 RepID=A0A365H9T0_9ACTN|nr:DUF4259 domain-containing protein [Actinomadura craniellae]RAY15904.1 hypothetical protein DPM19_09115 [Actinomadura craniellae]